MDRIGWLDGRRGGFLTGWTYARDKPRDRLDVSVLYADRRPIVLKADRYRADVQAAGHGDGCCGFACPIAPASADPVAVVWTDTGEPLPGGPPVARTTSTLRRRRGRLELVVDRPDAGDPALSGYVLDRSARVRRVDVGLKRGALVVASGRACLYREDAMRRDRDGFHGFRLSLPPMEASRAGWSLVDVETGRTLATLNPRWRRACGLA